MSRGGTASIRQASATQADPGISAAPESWGTGWSAFDRGRYAARRTSLALVVEPACSMNWTVSLRDVEVTGSVRYADDCNIYVRREQAGKRVMRERDGLHLEPAQAQGQRIEERQWLDPRNVSSSASACEGGKETPHRPEGPAPVQAEDPGTDEWDGRGEIGIGRNGEEPCSYLSGWRGYFGFCQTPTAFKRLDGWLRHRLRAMIWQQWRTWEEPDNRLLVLQLGAAWPVPKAAGSRRVVWHVTNRPAVAMGLPSRTSTLGIPRLSAGK